MSWLVSLRSEAGSWRVAGSKRLEVAKLATDDTVGLRVGDKWAQVGFSQEFAETPVVLTHLQTENDPHWVSTRQLNASAAGLQIALEEDEAQDTAHGGEVIGWLAIEPGTGMWDGHAYEAAHTGDSIRSWPTLVAFEQDFSEAPRFLASLASRDSEDNAHLRYRALTAGGLLLRVEEDRTWDAEMFHGTEVVDYLAIEGDGILTAEATDSERWYYYLDGLRVAMREGDVVFLIVSDHLGTTSLVLDEDEVYHSETRHYPYGTERWADGTVPTDHRFTGQRLTPQVNLYQMGARFYEPALGTWISADVIVPEPRNPQTLNRFAFVLSNPLRYTDPSGHGTCSGDDYDPACGQDIATVIWYIHGEMTENAAGEVVELLLDLNQSSLSSTWMEMPSWAPGVGQARNAAALADAAAGAEALALFAYSVRQGGPWDPKTDIGTDFGTKQVVDGDSMYYDIWGNIMFGYLGAAAGFSESGLLEGAGLEQIGSSIGYTVKRKDLAFLPQRQPGVSGLRSWDDPRDQAASQIGADLWRRHGLQVTPEHVRRAVTVELKDPW